MKILSLFDGISCGMIALERSGIFVTRYVAYEIDKDATKISEKNYPEIEHRGDVFEADFTEFKGFDLLIGGSPCTYWSIAKNNREVTPNGIGGKLFMEYKRALKESECKWFLYENNFSIHQDIKDYISQQLGVRPITINSALVSGQSRKRCYWTNIPVKPILDRNIKLSDVVDFSTHEFRPLGNWVFSKWGNKQKIELLKDVNSLKSHCLTTRKNHSLGYYLNEEHTMYCNLTVNDFERLQTIPTNYVNSVNVSEGAKYKAIGNGWTIEVIAHILRGLKEVE